MSNIIIVGVGALGSHVAQFLRAYHIKIIDFDIIESKNTLSQFHPKNSVGKPKTLALVQTMQFLWGVKLDAVPHKLVSNNVNELLKNSDLIIDCLDNEEARILVQDYARKNKASCLHGALSAADGGFARVVWDEDFTIDSGAVAGQATCEDGGQLPFICMVSAYLARSAQEFLLSGKKLGFFVYSNGGAKLF